MSFTPTDLGIQIRTGSYQYHILFYTEDIVRVHQFTEDQDTNPYAVTQKPGQVSFDVKEEGEVIFLKTVKVVVEIHKSPMRLIFKAPNGEVLNEDDAGLNIGIQGEQKTVYKKLQPGERFVGLGEKTGPLDKRGMGYQNWNTDHFAYDVEADPLYASIPFYIGIHSNLSYGIFLDNSYKSHFNFGASNNRFSSFSVDGGDLDYYFFAGSVTEIIQGYTWLTGRIQLPPIWSLGYQQCRYSYYPDKEVVDVARKFREKSIPADVIVLDIHYMEAYKIFSWDRARFPDPEKLVSELKKMGFEVVVICDPGIKIEGSYDPYESGVERDIFLKYPDGTRYEGEVWPGWCHFPDFTSEKARAWWTEMMKSYTDIGLKGFWNDMNEIATWGQMLPENIIFDFEEDQATSRKGRNVYGMQMAKSSFESAKENLSGVRPFILTRAGFSGVQRYSALWTGDNVASDEHMKLGVRMVNNLGLCGIAFAGYDVGGFAGDGDSQLFARWIQLGTFSPFFRGHSMINSNDAEPWSFGEEVEEIAANYISLRYKLLPYLYSLFYQATQTGIPVCRSLCIDYTHQNEIYAADYENQYLFGDSILVAPIGSKDRFIKSYLPEGLWYEFFTDEKLIGSSEIIREVRIEQLPLFVKGSAIIPVKPTTGINTASHSETIEVHIYKGEIDNSFEWYEDDGESYEFEDQCFVKRMLTYSPTNRTFSISKSTGRYQPKYNSIKLIFHGFESDELSRLSTKSESYAFVKPISAFDPFEKDDRDYLKIKNVHTLTTDFTLDEVIFSW